MSTAPKIAERQPLRLVMADRAGQGTLDGAWWPQSRDLEAEFADLAAHFPPQFGRVVRVIYSESGWSPAPRFIKVSGRSVRAGSFPDPDMQRVLLQTGHNTGSILQVMVVPPGFDADAAARAMDAAVSPTNRLSAAALLSEAAPLAA